MEIANKKQEILDLANKKFAWDLSHNNPKIVEIAKNSIQFLESVDKNNYVELQKDMKELVLNHPSIWDDNEKFKIDVEKLSQKYETSITIIIEIHKLF
jgi:hypothetical protein